MTRGLTKDHPFDPKDDFWVGTNLFRRFNGQWRLVMHWSGRLAPVHEQLQEMVRVVCSCVFCCCLCVNMNIH
jgi:hypothetical protein